MGKISNDKNNDFFSYFKVQMNATNESSKFGCCGFEIFGQFTKDFDYSYHDEICIKSHIPKTFKFETKEPLKINKQISFGQTLKIESKSSIIIEKSAKINTNGSISLQSDGDIINYGQVVSKDAITVQCGTSENFGAIKAVKNVFI